MKTFMSVCFLCLIFPIVLGKEILLRPKEIEWFEITSKTVYFRMDGSPEFSAVLVSQGIYKDRKNIRNFRRLYRDDQFERLCVDGVTSCHLKSSLDSKQTRYVGIMNLHSKRSGFYSYSLTEQDPELLESIKILKILGVVFGIIGIIWCCGVCYLVRKIDEMKKKKQKKSSSSEINDEYQELLDANVDDNSE